MNGHKSIDELLAQLRKARNVTFSTKIPLTLYYMAATHTTINYVPGVTDHPSTIILLYTMYSEYTLQCRNVV